MSNNKFYYLSLIFENSCWNIHGLWPQFNKTSYPQYCKNVTFNPSLLNPIKSDLEKYWSSDRESDNKFWEHEWKKHGSCMFTNMNEFNYFNKALTLFKKVSSMGIIEKYRQDDKAMIPFDLNFKIINKL